MQVLRSFTGSDYAGLNATVPPGSSLVEPGFVPAAPVTLSWQTFRQMAVEAGMSRCHVAHSHPAHLSALHFAYNRNSGVHCLDLPECDVPPDQWLCHTECELGHQVQRPAG